MPLTGRTRTVAITGTVIGGTSSAFNDLDSGKATHVKGRIGFYGDSFTFPVIQFTTNTFWGTGYNFAGVYLEVAASTGFGGENYFDSIAYGSEFAPSAFSIDVSGSFTCSVEVREGFRVVGLNSADIDADTNYPTYGNSSLPYTRGDIGSYIQFYEEIYDGSQLNLTGTIGGLSFNVSNTWSGGSYELAYNHSLQLSVDGVSVNLPLPDMEASITLMQSADSIGASHSFTYTGSGVSNTADTNEGLKVSLTGAIISGDIGGFYTKRNSGEATRAFIPKLSYNWDIVSYRYSDPYILPLTFVLRDKLGVNREVTFTGSHTSRTDQYNESFSCDLKGYPVGDDVPAARDSYDLEEQVPVGAWVKESSLVANDLDPWLWRTPIHGRSYVAYTIDLANSVGVFGGSGLTAWTGTVSSLSEGVRITGTATYTYTVPSNWETYRFLRLKVKGSGADNIAGNIVVNGKQWDFTTGVAGALTTIDLDLCIPSDSTWDTGTQYSRYPIEAFDINIPINEGDAWGINLVDSFSIEAVTNSIDLISIELVKKNYGLASFIAWNYPDYSLIERWTSPTDITYGFPNVYLNVDGRNNDLHDTAYVYVTELPETSYYTRYTLNDQFAAMLSFPGITGSLAGSYPDDYHNENLPAYFTFGAGILKDHYANSWVPKDKQAITGDVIAQPLYDFVKVYPGAGNVWRGGSSDYATPVCIHWLCNGRTEGIVGTEANLLLPGATVDSTPDGGTGVTDTIGKYYTALPFFEAGTFFDIGTTETTATGIDFRAGSTRRICLRGVTDTEGAILSYDVSSYMSHVLAYTGVDPTTEATDSELKVALLDNSDPGLIRAVYVTPFLNPVSACVLWDSTGNLHLWYSKQVEEAFESFYSKSLTRGETWVTEVSTGVGKHVTSTISPNGNFYEFQLTGSTVTCTILDRQRNTIESSVTVVTGVDDSGIASGASTNKSGDWEIFLWYVASGIKLRKVSKDGKVWVT